MGDNKNIIRTLVLVGRTGNGKSATGNTILGKTRFVSKRSLESVTRSSQLETAQLRDGPIINVIDTPGLFDSSIGIELVAPEILKCTNLAKDGIHAVLVVFSIRSRFSEEEASILQYMTTLFGNEIINYMIVVFTGGDDLQDDETLQDFLERECPRSLKDILNLCGNRMVLFDNKTKNESKRRAQVQELLSLVTKVVNQNNGKPYTNDFFVDLKKRQEIINSLGKCSKQDLAKLEETLKRNYEEMLKRITTMVEAKLNETIARLEKKLAEQEAVIKMADEKAQEIQRMSDDEICKLKETLEKVLKEKEKLENNNPETSTSEGGCCTIL